MKDEFWMLVPSKLKLKMNFVDVKEFDMLGKIVNYVDNCFYVVVLSEVRVSSLCKMWCPMYMTVSLLEKTLVQENISLQEKRINDLCYHLWCKLS